MSKGQLQDQIVQLQKLRSRPQIVEVADQAEQALAAGRDLEAEALIEKASALLTSLAS